MLTKETNDNVLALLKAIDTLIRADAASSPQTPWPVHKAIGAVSRFALLVRQSHEIKEGDEYEQQATKDAAPDGAAG